MITIHIFDLSKLIKLELSVAYVTLSIPESVVSFNEKVSYSHLFAIRIIFEAYYFKFFVYCFKLIFYSGESGINRIHLVSKEEIFLPVHIFLIAADFFYFKSCSNKFLSFIFIAPFLHGIMFLWMNCIISEV